MTDNEIKNLESQIKTGDIGLSINDSFLAKSIRFFMNVYRRIKGLNGMQLFNHSFLFIWINDELFVTEAIERGAVIRPYKSAYLKENIRHKIKTRIVPYTEEEMERLQLYSIEFMGSNREYDFMNFPFQIIYILSGGKKWYGKTGKKGRKRIYCTEMTATIVNHIRQTWDRPWAVNPLDIDTKGSYVDKIDLT